MSIENINNEINRIKDIDKFLPYIISAAGVLIIIIGIILCYKHLKRSQSKMNLPENGYEFETYCGKLLELNGFSEVEVTSSSRDYGVDIFAEKDGITYAFQCKYYDSPVGTKAVQEIYSGRDFYHCMVGVVLTNQTYTKGAYTLAEAHRILLWDGEKLSELENAQ